MAHPKYCDNCLNLPERCTCSVFSDATTVKTYLNDLADHTLEAVLLKAIRNERQACIKIIRGFYEDGVTSSIRGALDHLEKLIELRSEVKDDE